MLSKNLAWWQPDNSIHLIYPLDSADLLLQSIMLTISFPPGRGGRGRNTMGGGTMAGQRSPTQLDRANVWPRSTPATCPDISKHLWRGADISICPVEEGEKTCVSQFVCRHACLRAGPRSVSFLCYVWALMCIVLFFTLAWWPGKSLPKGRKMLKRSRRRKLMDLYQAIKTDNCHSSSGCLEVNPDQQGWATHGSHGAYKSQHATVSFGRPQQPGMTAGWWLIPGFFYTIIIYCDKLY